GHSGRARLEATAAPVGVAGLGERGPRRRAFDIARSGELVCADSPLGPVALRRLPRFSDPADQLATGSLLAPMPGTVIRLGAAVGERVSAGQPVLWLEAMKMEHTIAAPAEGVLTALNVEVGRQVELGEVLAVVDPDDAIDEK